MRKIKVIKKNSAKKKTPAEGVRKQTANARRVVDNVKDWVSDFKSKKQDETQRAISALFPKSPQNAES